ncbi:MAG: DUF4190 domain-containing protein, partial [Actinobacteria bacterium]|nr:DUF4190 domain-containing protein [Actinomycetota bacterium]
MSSHTPTAAQPMNVLSVVGFVLSILGFNIIAIILGAVSLSQIKKTGQRGRGFALAAIWIGAISLVVFIVVGIFYGVALINMDNPAFR